MRLNTGFLLLLILSYSFVVFGQDKEKCATVPYNKELRSKTKSTDEDFEKWFQSRLKQKRAIQSISRTNEDVYVIPVVIHVVHNGESVGTGANIPLTQIQQQLKILNDDFSKKNADTSKTPALFKSLAADTKIEFKLAIQDPDGVPTNGIVRVNGNKSGWRFEDGDNLKKISYWPAANYLNIWVANMTDNTIGFAQFPTSTNLPGLEEGSDLDETDGVVIHYREFGRGGNATNRSRGRTLTHEIGHYFGLKHIWGDDDGSCSGSDHVEDTPNQSKSNNNCPGFPSLSCGNSSDMFMNYMDYTPDTCMNIFTTGQKERMRLIIESSPRRTRLLTSPALSQPVNFPLDAAITKIVSPAASNCGNFVSPSFTLRNVGTTTLTSIVIDYKVNDLKFTEVKTLNLTSFNSATIDLPQLSLSSNPGNYILTIELKSPNGGTDQRLTNNILSKEFYVTPEKSLPYEDNFPNAENILILNSGTGTGWQIKNVGDNSALGVNFMSTNEKGTQDHVITPGFNTIGLDSLSLSFRYAYAQKDANSWDGLTIRVSLDCGKTFEYENEVFHQFGAGLATVTPTSSPFIPSQSNHWKESCLNLTKYIGFESLQIQFLADNGGGNSLYLDDLNFQFTACGDKVVGTEEDKISSIKLDVYPNPNDGKAVVDLSLPIKQDFEILMLDGLGKIVLQEKFRNKDSLHLPIDFSHLSSGLYFIKIQGKTINLDRKVIIGK